MELRKMEKGNSGDSQKKTTQRSCKMNYWNDPIELDMVRPVNGAVTHTNISIYCVSCRASIHPEYLIHPNNRFAFDRLVSFCWARIILHGCVSFTELCSTLVHFLLCYTTFRKNYNHFGDRSWRSALRTVKIYTKLFAKHCAWSTAIVPDDLATQQTRHIVARVWKHGTIRFNRPYMPIRMYCKQPSSHCREAIIFQAERSRSNALDLHERD